MNIPCGGPFARKNINQVIWNDGNVAVMVPFSSRKSFSPLYRDAWTERREAPMSKDEFRQVYKVMDGAEGAISNLLEILRISEDEFNEALQMASTDPALRQSLKRILVANRHNGRR
jgi:hypothetical protein